MPHRFHLFLHLQKNKMSFEMLELAIADGV